MRGPTVDHTYVPLAGTVDLATYRDHLLFNEYYHGETGAGLGASHQTGWSGLIALLLHPHRSGLAIDGISAFSTRPQEGA